MIALVLISATTQMVALAAVTGWSASPKKAATAAAVHAAQCGSAAASKPAGCPTTVAQPKLAGDAQMERVLVPTGAKQCPQSGPGVACATHSVTYDSGNSATPDGLPACPVDPSKPISAPGSCGIASTPAAAPSPSAQPAPPAPASPAANRPAAASPTGGASHSPGPSGAQDSITLTSTSTSLTSGGVIFLTAHSTIDVTGTPDAIEIFDTTTKELVAACTQGTDCKVSYSAKSGHHAFVAYVVTATSTVPSSGIRLKSSTVDVRFLGVSLQVAQPAVAGPGHAITFVANATEEIGKTGFVIEMHDAATGARLTYCRYGTTCSMSLVEPTAGTHTLIATLGPSDAAALAANPDVHAASSLVSATWLGVTVAASTSSPQQGNVVTLSAQANADLSQTPYSIYLLDQSGKQVGTPCNAATCTATTSFQGPNATYTAVIGRLALAGNGSGPQATAIQHAPASRGQLDVQAASVAVKAVHMLWGVDSCQRITDLFGQVNSALGHPDVWARYLPPTYNCGGLNGPEIALAHAQHIGILPIYNAYDCSAVSGYGTGALYAKQAVQWMQNDLVPAGTAIAVDIEPVSPYCAANVDAGFIEGWYDGITQGKFAPAYYGNTSPTMTFANAWCAAVQQRPEIATNSYLWSFEPSLSGSYTKNRAPHFGPYYSGCPGHYLAWQFQISAGSTPDVDQDEVSSDFPLWYP